MPDAAAHKWYVNALALLAVLLAGAAALAQLVGWKGPWALVLFIGAIGVGIAAGFVEKVIVPSIDGKLERVRRAEDERRRTDEETRRRGAEQQQAQAEDDAPEQWSFCCSPAKVKPS